MGSKALFSCSVALLAVCILINLPLMLEEISKRVGSELINTATGLVYFTSALSSASLTWVFGILMAKDTKDSSINTLLFGIALFSLCFFMSVMLYCGNAGEFKSFDTNQDKIGMSLLANVSD